ncbi:MAG: 3'-5' exonuclease [Treponema sp.]|jgi:DNA polymerase III epsilon subunit-like protein|nr:3'-5' exonuclease [Treponema sp.]
MTVVFSDTETTGLDPRDSAPFEISMLVYQGSQLMAEGVFHLNPLDDNVVIHADALEVNGTTEEQIRSYPPAAEAIPKIIEFLKPFCPPEKFVFGGYNAPFDYGQIGGLFFRHGVLIGDYFNGRLIDVLELVKQSKSKNLIKSTTNNKLGTITEALGIPHEKAHSAMGDIVATRLLYEHIYQLWRDKK